MGTFTSADARSINSSSNDADFDRRSQASVDFTGTTAGPSWLVHAPGGSSTPTVDDGNSVLEPEHSDGETDDDEDAAGDRLDGKATMGALDLLKSVSAKSAETRNGTIKASTRRSASYKGKGKSLGDLFAQGEPNGHPAPMR